VFERWEGEERGGGGKGEELSTLGGERGIAETEGGTSEGEGNLPSP